VSHRPFNRARDNGGLKVPWSIERCILCLGLRVESDEQTWMTDAHVLPASLGAKLSAEFLCRSCNSRVGHDVEAPLLADPAIRSCVEQLAKQLPRKLLDDLRERQLWFAETDLGRVAATMTDKGELRALQSKSFKQEEHARAEMRAEWKRQKLDEDEIAELLERFDAAPAGELLELPGFTVKPKTDMEALQFNIDWDGARLPQTLPLAIAFSYLALILGEDLVYDVRRLDPIRAALRANDGSASEHWHVEELRFAGGCAPEHRLAVEQVSPLVIHIQLFQEWVWRVSFPRLGLKQQPPWNYAINVSSGTESSW
jgi:hypothetical protein